MTGATGMAEPEVIVRGEGALGLIRLNRPAAINALTLDMVRLINTALDLYETDPATAIILIEGAGERGFCAGGDLRSLYESIRYGGDLGKVFWREEYSLNARIAALTKPYVAYMDGLVMGGGVGLSAHGHHRVVTEKTSLAMPETGIGFFPDVGGSWLLSRAGGELGTYFGLTGRPMNSADAIRCGLADVCIPTASWPEARAALGRLGPGANSGMVRGILGHHATPRQQSVAEQHKALIDRAFAFDKVEDILAALGRETEPFAQETRDALLQKSPTSLKVTLRLLRTARQSSSLQECLVREYGAALEIFVARDFPEGIRAAIIDKDRAPKWQPPILADVTNEMVDRYFAPRGIDELVLPHRRIRS